MTSHPPRIGVTRGRSTPHKQMGPYLERLRQAGADPVEVGPEATILSPDLRGLLLTGGPDVAWWRYGDQRHPQTEEPDAARDEMELALLQAALAKEIPVLAICRGNQVLNVAMGGGLVQHIDSNGHRALANGDSAWNRALVQPQTRLAPLLGSERSIAINCRHHQVVDDNTVPPDLTVAARAEDGTIEALESPRHAWVVGIQWHPERCETGDDFAPIFADFVRACSHCSTSCKPDDLYHPDQK
ncbi:MAG: gamma-glutamyl-gamma-aminobutyrate hydrolase family protein [Dehalococcoidia bacterium]